ncbi:MAG: EVE domain-containing protein [Phycisphaerae bacterium]|nr:EVE domain-containing protein [Phycisphaerae bacterium]
MNRWLVKSDPGEYGFADLERERRTRWDGVRNAQALINLRKMQKGDAVLIYHTGDKKQIVGLAEVASNPYIDPEADDDRTVVVDLKAKGRVARPVSLGEIKKDERFAEFALVRNSRLSVMPVSEREWKALAEMGEFSA